MGNLRITDYKDGVPVESPTIRDQKRNGGWYEFPAEALRRQLLDASRDMARAIHESDGDDVTMIRRLHDITALIDTKLGQAENRIW